MTIKRNVYLQILRSFPSAPPENGCILGASGDLVCAFAYDGGNSATDQAIYVPNVEMLNQVIRQWSLNEIQFVGICHSHPRGQSSLSGSDIAYIHDIMIAMPDSIDTLYFPLVFPGQTIHSFVAHRCNGRVDILPDNIIIKS